MAVGKPSKPFKLPVCKRLTYSVMAVARTMVSKPLPTPNNNTNSKDHHTCP